MAGTLIPDADHLLLVWSFLEDVDLHHSAQVCHRWQSCGQSWFWKRRCRRSNGADAHRQAGWRRLERQNISSLDPSGEDIRARALTRETCERIGTRRNPHWKEWRRLQYELALRPFSTYGLELGAVSATSEDHAHQSAGETLDPRSTAFWSSTGSESPVFCPDQVLVYDCVGGLCVLNEVSIVPYRCPNQQNRPCYAPSKLRITISLDLEASHVTWTSPELSVDNVNDTFRYRVAPLVIVGKFIHVHLIGRQQKQKYDDLYYVCVESVSATGHLVELGSSSYMRYIFEQAREKCNSLVLPVCDSMVNTCRDLLSSESPDMFVIANHVKDYDFNDRQRWSIVLAAGPNAKMYLTELLERKIRLTADETVLWWKIHSKERASDSSYRRLDTEGLLTPSEPLADLLSRQNLNPLAGQIYLRLDIFDKYINVLTECGTSTPMEILILCTIYQVYPDTEALYNRFQSRGLSRLVLLEFLVFSSSCSFISSTDACRLAGIPLQNGEDYEEGTRKLVLEKEKERKNN